MQLRFKFLLNIILVISASSLIAAKSIETPKEAKENGIIELEIIKDTPETVEARIKNLTETARKKDVDKISIIGQKKQNDKTTEITWDKIKFKEKKADLQQSFQSKVLPQDKIEQGDKFKAKGDNEALASAIEQLLNPEGYNNSSKNNSSKSNSIKPLSGSGSSGGISGNNSTRLSTLSSIKDNPAAIASSTTGEETTTTSGCTVRVDYDLNKVFVQERTMVAGKETQSCKDSATSFSLQKDYESCPNQIDTIAKKVFYYFQYFYNDDKNSKNVIGNCQIDSSLTSNLQITKSYNCADFIDLAANKVYSQYQESYKDKDSKDIIIKDCSIDYEKAYTITQDLSSCGIKHLFDQSYSVAQNKLFYTKDSKQIIIQDCAESTIKYPHITTTDTCTPIVNNNQVTIFNRKYITVDGIRQYITDCTPLSSNVTIKEEICTSNQFTHDFTAGQSFYNKTYYYIDGNNQKVNVSTCVKSDEAFPHLQDSSICVAQNDDPNLKTNLFAKKYILVNSVKQYITDCQQISPAVPYLEIGYQWKQEYYLPSTPISVANSGDNVYIGSAQGEASYTVSCMQTAINIYNISNYSTSGKCNSWSSPSYSGNAIDLSYSNLGSVTISNFVENRSTSPLCFTRHYNTAADGKTCLNPYQVCNSGNNTLYYQRCNSHACPLYKLNKVPVYKRSDTTKYVNDTKILGSKYTCGNNSLSGVEVLY